MKKTLRVVLCILMVGFFGCRKPAPQLPSNKGSEIDSTSFSLLALNRELAVKEDSVLKDFAEKTGIELTKTELGFWYIIKNESKGEYLKVKDNCRIRYKMMLLDGTLLEEKEIEFAIGKKEIIVGLEEGLKLLRKGDSATFIIPWYLAFGMKGNDTIVQPYTSLIYEVEVIK